MSAIRTFIAVEIFRDIRSNIERWIRSLQHKVNGVKWVETQNLHVTLKFLGDVAADDLPEITNTVMKATSQVEPFTLELFGSGAFPNMKAPRTIWIGCRDGAKQLTRLAMAIEDALSRLDFPKEARPFSPHLTIGRAKQKVADMTPLLTSGQAESFGQCSISEASLFSSDLTRSGPIYKKLAALPLCSSSRDH